jgi:cytochrome c peroxidase
MRQQLLSLAVGAGLLVLAACGQDAGTGPEPMDGLSAEAALGEKIFNDTTLSASGRMACASCHVEAAGHAQDNALAAQLGGPALDRQGRRTAPSIRYLAFAPAFRLDSRGAPSGGLFWDGRAGTLAEQAGQPFFNEAEMALPDRAALATRLAAAPYAAEFRALYGADVLDRPDEALARATQALERYQREDADFAPFTSKFDAVQRGQAQFSAAEQRGLALFNDAGKGNCAFCHTSSAEPGQPGALFTNFSYHVLGVPRNPELAANADASFFDLGLCARAGGDLAARADLCGAFRTPSLRNVALRRSLFHNGRFKTLHEALAFYVQRDTHPERFYPLAADGSVLVFDDLPVHLRGNVDRRTVPYDRSAGGTPALDAAEIDDVLAFLRTLSDGWSP